MGAWGGEKAEERASACVAGARVFLFVLFCFELFLLLSDVPPASPHV